MDAKIIKTYDEMYKLECNFSINYHP